MVLIEQSATLNDADVALLAEIKAVIRKHLPDATALLYGSAARGARTPESDYDILILAGHPVTRENENAIEDAIYDLQVARGVVISTVYWTQDEWDRHPNMPFRVEVAKDALVL